MKTEFQTDMPIVLDDLKIGYRKTGKSVSIFGPIKATIREGEMVGLIGRNGIGKSTLLRTLAGLQPLTGGKIYLNGISIKKISLKEMAHLVSYVSTDTVRGFQIHVREIITLGRFPYTGWLGRLDQNDKVAISDAILHTRISHLLNKSVLEISDGERQKVMIARALAQDTPIIILDEPTAFLDLPSRFEILRLLNDLTINNGKTTLFSTHDLQIAMDVADKLWLMSGEEIYQGSPEDLLINGAFRKLFLSSPTEFDPVSMQFRFFREFKKKIRITGDLRLRSLTQRAMERIGIGITNDKADLLIEIKEINEKHEWHLIGSGTENIFFSIYDLAIFLKMNFLTNTNI
jgi:iron complex transport system ATP-binding protein